MRGLLEALAGRFSKTTPTDRTTSRLQNFPFVPLGPNLPCSTPVLPELEVQSLGGPWRPYPLAECHTELKGKAEERLPSRAEEFDVR